jgi:hypothetical protein
MTAAGESSRIATPPLRGSTLDGSPICFSLADAAAPVPVAFEFDVLCDPRVPLGAMRLKCALHAAQDVDAWSNELEVVGVYARRLSAEVVDVHSGRFSEAEKHDPMAVIGLLLKADL